jgi:hypothetical protein
VNRRCRVIARFASPNESRLGTHPAAADLELLVILEHPHAIDRLRRRPLLDPPRAPVRSIERTEDCSGVQYPAGKQEAAVREALGRAETLRMLRDAGADDRAPGAADARAPAAEAPAPDSDALRRVWSALDFLTQDRLAARMVDRIEFGWRNSEMRITLKREVLDALKPVFEGVSDDGC